MNQPDPNQSSVPAQPAAPADPQAGAAAYAPSPSYPPPPAPRSAVSDPRAKSPGLAGFLQKPYTPEQLAAKVKEALSARGNGR